MEVCLEKRKVAPILSALSAALLYAVSIPFSKLLLVYVQPVFMSAFLYIGAGAGIGVTYLLTRRRRAQAAEKLAKAELPFVAGMIVLDIAAPILLMLGLSFTSAASVSLLSNFEIAATAIIALVIFKELISKRLWLAISLITLASMLLSFEDMSGFRLSFGSLFVIAACVCWGFENNCTRKISSKSTYEIVFLKGVFSGAGSLGIAFILGEKPPSAFHIALVMLLGFVSYGLSIFFYVRAQKELGAAKTSAYYAVAPFAGMLLSCILLREHLTWMFFLSLPIMAAGVVIVVQDTLVREHAHLHTHVIVHTHDGSTHSHAIQHAHPHTHMLCGAWHGHHHDDLKPEE